MSNFDWTCDLCGSDNSDPGAGIISHVKLKWCKPCYARAGYKDEVLRFNRESVEPAASLADKSARLRVWRERLGIEVSP